MSKEFVPLVDSQGKYLGEVVSRDRVHKEELWHPVVHIWVLNEGDKLLL